MATDAEKLSPAGYLEQRIHEHLKRRRRRSAEDGDPAEAMGRFLIERFGLEALQETYGEYRRNRYEFMYDDHEDEDEDKDEHDLEDEKTHGREPG
jgi:hypothetical protein